MLGGSLCDQKDTYRTAHSEEPALERQPGQLRRKTD